MRLLFIILIFLCGDAHGQIINASNPYRVRASASGISLVVETGKASTNGGVVVTDAINTTGATLIVVAIASIRGTAQTIGDSKSNTWTALTEQSDADEVVKIRLYYCYSPTVGSGHTFSAGGNVYPNVHVYAFSGTTGSYGSENGSNGASPLASGTVTPATNGEVIVAALGANLTTSVTSVTSGFTNTDQASVTNGAFFLSMAYYVQPTAAAQGCTFTWTANSGANKGAVAIATFK